MSQSRVARRRKECGMTLFLGEGVEEHPKTDPLHPNFTLSQSNQPTHNESTFHSILLTRYS